MTSDEVRTLIETDPDYIFIKRFEFSLEKLMERYPDGAPPKVVAQALMMTEEEVQDVYETVIVKLRQALKVELD